ncbi:hypothetical protein LUCX_92 [Xanthomonas phage vB_XciM_LucasX]|nr:hypothetical protein LUCX_92 [Xanthomonas phage vB_XciM_LucasX]
MLDQLEAYLHTTATAPMRVLVMDCCHTLDAAGVDQHRYLLSNVLGVADSGDRDLVFEGIFGTLHPILTNTLKEFGIAVHPEIELAQLNSIMQGVQRISNWDDRETLNSLLDNVEGNEASLADILEITSDLSAGEYMLVLKSVSDDLIARIGEVTQAGNPEPQPDELLVAAAQKRLCALLPKARFDEESVFIIALDEGLRLGLPFEMAIEPHLEALHAVPVSKLGAELVAFAYASDASLDAIPALLAKLKETFELSIPDLMVLDRDIKSLL